MNEYIPTPKKEKKPTLSPLEMLDDFQRKHKNQQIEEEKKKRELQIMFKRKKEIVSMLNKNGNTKTLSQRNKASISPYYFNTIYRDDNPTLPSNERTKSSVLKTLELMKTKLIPENHSYKSKKNKGNL